MQYDQSWCKEAIGTLLKKADEYPETLTILENDSFVLSLRPLGPLLSFPSFFPGILIIIALMLIHSLVR